jgi:signal recognition particle receptor subunit beta
MGRLAYILCLGLAFVAPAHASFINYSSREINVKVVYYGPPSAGLHDNLAYIYSRTNPEAKGKMIALKTEDETTEFFDFLPLSLGEIRGFKVRFHLYTTPGRQGYDASRKLILKGADGIVFVADAARAQKAATLASWKGLQANLAALGYDWQKMPLVVQLDHRGQPDALSTSEIKEMLGVSTQPTFEAESATGVGVFDSLKAVAKLVLTALKQG